jgi:formyltetrahydrofolate-dependent phosphoribosylglycinamide formyltransferase
VKAAATLGNAVNLLAELDQARFGQRQLHRALVALDAAGVRIERFAQPPEDVLAWIDAEFDGTWSSEAHAAGICVARRATKPIGFAAFDAQGLRFAWLRRWNNRPEVGLFGPFAVVPEARGSGVGKTLLAFAMFSLRERGYSAALIPVVKPEALVRYYEREAAARPVEAVDLTLGGRRWRTTVLASGSGTNFQSVIDGSRDASPPLPVEVTALVCNRRDAYVLERARHAGIPAHLIAWQRGTARAQYDDLVLDTVAQTEPDLVLLLGWMHVLPPRFVQRFPDALNIHPAFLPLDHGNDHVAMPDGSRIPAFRGVRAVDDAIAAGCMWGGASVHRVREAVDRGEVVARAPLRRLANESKDAFLARLHELEHRVLATAIRRWSYERGDGMTSPL